MSLQNSGRRLKHLKKWAKTKWISSLFFMFFFTDFLLSNAHYLKHDVRVEVTDTTYYGYIMEGGDVEMWVRDFTWYIRVALLLLLPIIMSITNYKASKKEIAGAVIYTVIAFKDCRDFLINHNTSTSLTDYTILFISLTLVHVYFSLKQKV